MVADRQGPGLPGRAREGAVAAARSRLRPGRSSTSPGDANQAKILDREGKAIQGNNPTFGLGVDPEDERFNPFELVEGDWASGPGGGRRDVNTADEQGFRHRRDGQGRRRGPGALVLFVGIARFGDVDSLGGATIALFDVPPRAQCWRRTGFDAIAVGARDGVGESELIDAIATTLPGHG